MSPSKLIFVAKVDGAFGVRGEVRLTAFTGDPLALLDYGALVRDDGTPGLTLKSGRAVKGGLIVRAAEVTTREEAQGLRGLGLYVERARLPEPDEDEYYLADLVGLRAVTPEGEVLGLVKSVHNFGAGDLLEIAPDDGGASWWSPFTRAAAPEVSLTEGRIVLVRAPETIAEPES